MEHKLAVFRLATLILVFSVVVFGAAARHSQCLPQSDPEHFLFSAAKMDVGHSQVLHVALVAQPNPDVLPAPGEFRVIAIIPCEKVTVSQIIRTLCLQHRSPPFSLA